MKLRLPPKLISFFNKGGTDETQITTKIGLFLFVLISLQPITAVVAGCTAIIKCSPTP
jgi:hypothetical protein